MCGAGRFGGVGVREFKPFGLGFHFVGLGVEGLGSGGFRVQGFMPVICALGGLGLGTLGRPARSS